MSKEERKRSRVRRGREELSEEQIQRRIRLHLQMLCRARSVQPPEIQWGIHREFIGNI